MKARYHTTVCPTPRQHSVSDRIRLVRDMMAERDLDKVRKGRFGYRADREDFARDPEEAKWPTDREGRVTRKTDLEHNEAEELADALAYGVSYYCGRGTCNYLSSVAHRGPRPLTAGLLEMTF
jgi:hypothetical protein